jgi:hypothetical protein
VNDADLQWIGNTALSYGIGGAMLEHIGSGYEDLHQDLTLGQNSSWSQYTIAKPYFWGSQDDGGAYYLVDDTDASNPKIIMGSRTRFLRQYFLFVREGAVRIGASASVEDPLQGDAAFSPVAFVNADGKNVVVVKANNGGSLTIQGLPAGTYGIKYTTANEYDVDRPDVAIGSGQPVNASIPAAGVVTIYAKASSATPTPVAAIPLPVMTSTSTGIGGQSPRTQRVCVCVVK